MIGFLTVLLGVFEAARSDSVLRQSALASPMIVYGIAIVASVGWVILAVQAASVLRRVFSTTPDSESKTDNLKGGDIGFLAPLAAIIILLGILPAPFCFGFCRAAVDALLKLLT